MKVYLVAQTRMNHDAVREYLTDVGGTAWLDRRGGSDGEQLIEFMGRLCYRSWEPGLNPNVTRVRSDSEEYMQNLIEVGHGSVLEHTWASFVFAGVSRVFTHELVRHRVGTAVSQESLRFVRVEGLEMDAPEVVVETPAALEAFYAARDEIESAYRRLVLELGIGEMTSFADKKVATSAARRVLPMGLPTTVGWSANLRTIRHVLEARTDPHAEEEIRRVFDEVAHVARREWPAVFADYQRMPDGTWYTDHRHV